MIRRKLGVVLGTALAAALAACSDQPVQPAGAPASAALPASAQEHAAPWRGMTDAELAGHVARAGGRVFIGFKELGAARGVDARGRVLVSEATVGRAKADLRARGLELEREYRLTPTVVARIPAHLVPVLRKLPFVDVVEPIFPGERLAQSTPWSVSQIGAPAVWPTTRGAGVKLLVIDSGAPGSHEDLSVAARYRCGGVGDYDTDGHGTFVSGVAAALNNTVGVVGVASGVSLYVAKDGDAQPDPAATACGVEWGRLQGVFVMNISTGYATAYESLTNQIVAAYNEGRLIVASAGNDYGGAIRYPASLPEVIAVGATTSALAKADFSNVGAKLELVAPGKGITSTTLPTGFTCTQGGKYGTCDGTSFSSPAVAAVAALVKAANPWFSNVDVRTRLQQSATDLGAAGRDTQFGYGLVDAQLAALGQKTTTEYRSWDCYYERGGHIWVSRETWARDTTYYLGGTVVVGDPYYVGYEEYDTGPTAGIGPMSCDYYDGTWY